jgi:hypothetical protein
VIRWLPITSDEVVKVPLPEVRLAVPRVVEPSKKVTVPVGVPTPGEEALTVAVNVTAWLKDDGLSDEVTVAELFALLTV